MARGGHCAVEATIRQRYDASRAKLIALTLLSTLHVYDNSSPEVADSRVASLLALKMNRCGIHCPLTPKNSSKCRIGQHRSWWQPLDARAA